MSDEAEIFESTIVGEGDGYCIEHNHFDCPACGKKYAGTSIYGCDVYELLDENPEDQFECEECKATFQFMKREKGKPIRYWRVPDVE